MDGEKIGKHSKQESIESEQSWKEKWEERVGVGDDKYTSVVGLGCCLKRCSTDSCAVSDLLDWTVWIFFANVDSLTEVAC